MILRRIAVFIALLSGILASQLPEFAQQYRQRLGGAIDEIRRMIGDFDADVARMGLSRDQGIERLKVNADQLIRQRGQHLESDIARADKLERQLQSYAEAGPFRRLGLFASDFEPEIARRAFAQFEPAVPVTSEGLISAAGGFFAGWFLCRLVLAPLQRRKRKAVPNAARG
ncbi:DUF2937 family protein [Phreatobacter stygius]|uniref:DUF2937 family protein n=1 Tax=Phreatobacter stygius TaxID=1940610 RepID=A0A4D7B585_9HYPH|nr:DUF2937 family protein [Phreatobacter stygius]QCI68151.1 DUF2937 family protein [Phreatobacter stygius]